MIVLKVVNEKGREGAMNDLLGHTAKLWGSLAAPTKPDSGEKNLNRMKKSQ